MRRLEPGSSVLLVIDVQEKLWVAMPEDGRRDLQRASHVLLEAASALSVPVLVTEQYPEGLGPTIEPLRGPLEAVQATSLAKLTFSAAEAPGFPEAYRRAGARRSVVVVGMETHICVFQTVRELTARGLDVHVVSDGVLSRRADHRVIGLDLCRSAGATITTAETVAFDWLRRAGGDAFKRISKAVR
jgi:nicotinamidase-related amidase